MTNNQKLKVIILLGRIMLRSGAETYRVEDTLNRIAYSQDISSFHTFAIPTGIFISYMDGDREIQTLLKRITKISTDLEKLDSANEFARKLTINPTMSYDDAMTEIERIEATKKYSLLESNLMASFAGSLFVLMFGGNLIEATLAYISSIALLFILNFLDTNFFIKNMFGGLLTAVFALFFSKIFNNLGYQINTGFVTIGPLMLLVPGVALTVGIKDVISGELIAGNARITEALFTAIAIAIGVGVIYVGF